MFTPPGSGTTNLDKTKSMTDLNLRGHAAFATRSLVAANDAAIMRARLEAFVRPVTFAQSRRVA